MQQVALSWLVYRLNRIGDPARRRRLRIANPDLAFGFHRGVINDRYSTQRVAV
jgi:hypothetical protein